MEKFRERLDLALKQKGISQAEFARKMSTEPQNVNLWKVRGGIPRAHFIKACDVLDVDPAWLSEGTSKSPHAVKEAPNTYQVHSKPVPLISSVAAGNWKDIGDNYDPKDEQDWVLSTVTTSENAFALRIQGDSMEPDIKDNEIVIVDPLRIAEHNSIVIVIQNGNTEATCKQLVIDGGKRYLKPINPRYPIMEMQADARLCGVVVQSLKTWI